MHALLIALALAGQAPPTPAPSQPVAASAQARPPAKTEPAAQPPGGQWVWQPQAPPPTAPPPPTGRYVWVPDREAAPPPPIAQTGVYAAVQPVQQTQWVGTATQPTTVVMGPGFFGTSMAWIGQRMVNLGSKTHVWTISHQTLRVGQPAPATYASTLTQSVVAVPQPINQVQYLVPPAPPERQLIGVPRPPDEAAPPPPVVPSPQSGPPRRAGLFGH